ncbi:MAG TPA: DUF6766 family protein [Edaphobacter sp.]|nr:DUF6766 family protein [Edaphobacter sp.]
MGSAARWFRENGLLISFFLLCVFSGLGQALTGVRSFNADRASHGFAAISLLEFLRTGTFLDGIAVNWQAALLQLYALIILGVFLYQKGAPHSRKLTHPRKRSRTETWIYRNSLSLAFLAMFLLSVTAHAIFGAAANNEERMLMHRPPVAVRDFLQSAKFWTSMLACWEAEFFAMFVYFLFTIFLRQQSSPESKPEEAPNEATGEVNK